MINDGISYSIRRTLEISGPEKVAKFWPIYSYAERLRMLEVLAELEKDEKTREDSGIIASIIIDNESMGSAQKNDRNMSRRIDYKSTEAYSYLKESGYSDVEILRMHCNSWYFWRQDRDTFEKYRIFLNSKGITDEMIRENPLFFSQTMESFNARMQFLSQEKEVDFTELDDTKIAMLCQSDYDFEYHFGREIEELLRVRNEGLYYRLADRQKGFAVQGLLDMYPFTKEDEKNIQEKLSEIQAAKRDQELVARMVQDNEEAIKIWNSQEYHHFLKRKEITHMLGKYDDTGEVAKVILESQVKGCETTEVYKYFTNPKGMGFSNAQVLEMYINNTQIFQVDVEEIRRRRDFCNAIGITNKMIKENPVILTPSAEVIYARMKFLSEYEKIDFSQMDESKIKKLMMNDTEFEWTYGKVIEGKLDSMFPEASYSLNSRYSRERIRDGLSLIYPMTDDDYKGVIDAFIERSNEEERISIKKCGIDEIRPDEDETGGGGGSRGTKHRMTPDEKRAAEMGWTRLKEKLKSQLGDDMQVRRVYIEKKREKDASTPERYYGFEVGNYVVLEAIGSIQSKATYVVQKEAIDILPYFSRSEWKKLGFAFSINHIENDKKKQRVIYNYDSEYLPTLVDTLLEESKKERGEFIGKEVLISDVQKALSMRDISPEKLSSEAILDEFLSGRDMGKLKDVVREQLKKTVGKSHRSPRKPKVEQGGDIND